MFDLFEETDYFLWGYVRDKTALEKQFTINF